jgi:hypothetical protein
MDNSNPPRPSVNYTPAFLIGILGTGLLGLLCIIVVGGLAYFRGFSPTAPTQTFTPAPMTVTPLSTGTAGASTLTPIATSTALPSATFTFAPTLTPSATFVYYTPTFLPTRTRTPTSAPTKTFTPSPTSTLTLDTIHDTSYAIAYNSWIGLPDSQTFGRGLRCSARKGEVLAFDVPANAVKLALFFYRGPNQGKVRIILDDVAVETLDLYKNSEQYQFAYNVPLTVPKQNHELRLVVLHEKRNASSGYQVCFDGLRVNNKPVDDNYIGVRYDAWTGLVNGHAVEGAYRMASIANSVVTFDVVGNQFYWVTARGPNFGLAEIYVDDQLMMTADLYFRAMQWNYAIHVQNLGGGGHTVKIVVKGEHNPQSGGDGIVFDGFRIP